MTFLDDQNFDPYDEQPTLVECKFCGKGSLEWEDDNGRWVLLESNGKVHRCDQKRVTKNVEAEFDVLD